MKVAGTVDLDLRGLEPNDMKRALLNVMNAPQHTSVILRVGADQLPDLTVVSLLRDQGERLGRIDVRCSAPGTTRRWVLALRGEDDLW